MIEIWMTKENEQEGIDMLYILKKYGVKTKKIIIGLQCSVNFCYTEK